MLIINNKEYYNTLIQNGFANKKINKRDLYFLAREWNGQGLSRQSIFDMLVDYCNKWDGKFKYAKYESLILAILDSLSKQATNNPTPKINFTKSEISKIMNIKDKIYQNIVFTMMCIAKAKNIDYVYINSKSAISLNDICELAKVKVPKTKQNLVLFELHNSGIICTEIKPIGKYTLSFMETTGDVELSFDASSEMVLEFEKYRGEKITNCTICGKLVKNTNGKVKYCKECAKKQNSILTNAKK